MMGRKNNQVTALHDLLRLDNHTKVREIVSSSPDILWSANSIGWNALHVAASVGWKDDAWLLNKAAAAASQDSFVSARTHSGGHSCISLFFRHYVDPLPWHDDEIKTAAFFLRGDLLKVTHDSNLLCACRTELVDLQTKHDTKEAASVKGGRKKQVKREGTPLLQSVSVSRVLQFVTRMELWLRAAYPREESFSLLHALAYVGGCPTEVALFAVSLFPEQASTSDENGHLPLHLLCTSEPANKDDCQALLQALLTVYPEAARCTNRNGRLPLNSALASGKGGAFAQLLIETEPRVLYGTRDVETRLPSFALAAAAPTLETHLHAYNTSNVGSLWHFLPPHAQKERLEQARRELGVTQLNTIYEILRAMPDAVQFGLD